ncbi:hypothetical protein [uncultured Winogradskyella sp.]|uniref:hypothetical protein n=1 Tax=uncultured Winogradskyella sp. TaxID=395353 RepID=UPI002631C1F7|nr:hypothetical protein [uncultured Winogradskyella sp.]
MQFTLDSVKHAKAVLKEKYKGEKINVTPLLEIDLSNLTESEEKVYYFGITTIGTNANNIIFYDSSTEKIIEVTQHNQIILLFNNIKSFDSDDNEVTAIKGQFRGFELRIE